MDESIGFKFSAIQLVSKSMEAIPAGFSGIINFDIKVESQVQAPAKLVINLVTVNIREEEKSDALATLLMAYYFEIPEFEKFILLDKASNLYTIPTQLDNTLRPVSISTTRGVVYSELRGTYLGNVIMPVVFLNDLQPFPSDADKRSLI